ncbi:MAG: CoA pyrophosphatase [Gammaproteobacteria bacterium]|nr:CoA pyrophosphatase [Gammaproteobacteria bacterium]MBU1646343.1 CoA pyrophosphatase [Gammaproteobacteria bacterium]MBU1970886.1 CoA pyrophosphatase [Gammaproteobacteria bacterium]
MSVIELRQRLASPDPLPHIRESGAAANGVLTAAAVLVPIINRPSGLTILLTQRTAHLRDHAGQVSFPGGRCEAGDADPVATALREAEEEVGVLPAQVEVLGRLPEYFTSTGFRVTPVVGLVTPPLNLKLDDFEVAEVFEPPLSFLLDPANHQRQQVEWQGALREFWAMPWQGYYIWGATAGMLVSLHAALTTEQ